ncbi:DcrB-related protein [Enterobacteriaceae bacterium BIT-l23]|uniref:DcrB-related protein n=1 Tax=Jejubacter sp. L23 TaxID=3092086 RepID=UPI0015858FA6|nr:DcrB-related protein [Enterobacteriaceae bacterium BIT-l23]
MADYILQEATLSLPDIFKDRTMNLFTLNENGASDFTFVVSRATAEIQDTVDNVAARIINELETTVPKFKLISLNKREVSGEPAVEICYQFFSDNTQVIQRQTVVLLNDAPVGKKIVCYTGTCPGEFTGYYKKQYGEIIKSIKFHHNSDNDKPEQMISAQSLETFFVLDCASRCLESFAGLNALYQSLNLQRALNGQYLFYSQAGSPLRVSAIPDSHPTRYALWTVSSGNMASLNAQLSVCRSFLGLSQLDSEDKVRAFLKSAQEG